MDFVQKAWMATVAAAAETAGHIFPSMAACEAALESGYGNSQLGKLDYNLFGMKQHVHPIYGTHTLPTREFVGLAHDTTDGKQDGWVVVNADWVKYPSFVECFADRMATLRNLAPHYPHYAAALAALDCDTYVVEVSKSWSTDPNRAATVQAIHKSYGL